MALACASLLAVAPNVHAATLWQAPAEASARAPQEPEQSGVQGEPLATSERGLVGTVTLSGLDKPIRAKADQPLSAPILVRVGEARTDQGSDGETRTYRIEFIGAVAGDYDLRDLIEFSDGTPASSLKPLPVRVVSQLPREHGSDLFSVPDPPFRLESHYRTIFLVLAAGWLAVPIVVLTRRWLRRVPPPVVEPVPPAPTIADLLRPLVEAARDRGLSIREQGRLELLLLQHWRARLGIGDLPPAAAIASLRAHPEAGHLLRAVERWLHARGGGDARPEEDIASLLAPYAEIEASDELRAVAGTPGGAPAAIPAGATGTASAGVGRNGGPR